jgi:hypothetical protein
MATRDEGPPTDLPEDGVTRQRLIHALDALSEVQLELDQERLARERAETLLEQVLTAMSDAVLVVDARGKVSRANDAAEGLFGRSIGDLLDADPADLLSADVPATPWDLLDRDPSGRIVVDAAARRPPGSEAPGHHSEPRWAPAWRRAALACDGAAAARAARRLRSPALGSSRPRRSGPSRSRHCRPVPAPASRASARSSGSSSSRCCSPGPPGEPGRPSSTRSGRRTTAPPRCTGRRPRSRCARAYRSPRPAASRAGPGARPSRREPRPRAPCVPRAEPWPSCGADRRWPARPALLWRC